MAVCCCSRVAFSEESVGGLTGSLKNNRMLV